MIKIIVTGGRNFENTQFVFDTMHRIRRLLTLDEEEQLVIIHGGARGVDSIVEQWTQFNFLESIVYLADWNTHGKAAGPIRNREMLDNHDDVDIVLAFPGGPGTNHMKTLAKKRGHLVLEVSPIEDSSSE